MIEQDKEPDTPPGCSGSGGFLKLLLVGAGALLVVQLASALPSEYLAFLDVRNWSADAWLWANFGAVAVLIAVRFGPDIRARAMRTHSKEKAEL